MKKNLKTLLGYLLEGETVSQRPFMLSLDNLVAHRNSLYDAYDHCVYRNRCSKTSGPIVVVEIGDGKYQLIDGYHRLVEHLLLRGGKKPIEAILGGIGSDQYAIASSGGRNRWVGNSSLKHGNLEDLFGGSEEEINGMIDDSVEKIRNARQLNDKTAKRGDLFENGVGGDFSEGKIPGSEAIWYHTTSRENAEKILREGLRINPSGKGKSRGSLDWMPEAYGGITPIFLSRKPGRYVNGVVLRVDVSGLGLVADIPGLVDFDGRLTDHSVYWDEEETPEIIWDLMDPETGESVNGELEFEWLREPGNDISGAAIELTGTAAVMEDIAPSRIELTDMIVENVNEAMKTMPPWTYYVEISGDQRVIYIKMKSEARGRPKYIGIIKIERSISVPQGGTVWEVSNVEADEGYGPMLYDLAMEMVLLVGGVGLMPDRTFVSPSARAVWAKYYNRGDINKEPLPEDMFDFSDMRNRPDYMRYYYSKSGTPLMDSLKAKELVKSEDFIWIEI